jgi:hypothetical protein
MFTGSAGLRFPIMSRYSSLFDGVARQRLASRLGRVPAGPRGAGRRGPKQGVVGVHVGGGPGGAKDQDRGVLEEQHAAFGGGGQAHAAR